MNRKDSRCLGNRPVIDKWDLKKFKGFCTAKEIVYLVKRQPKKIRENIHTGRIAERVLMSRIYKELKKLNTKTACNQLLKKWSMELNSGLSKEETEWIIKTSKVFGTLSFQKNANYSNLKISSYSIQNGYVQENK